jgi:hypothetical protein
MNMCVCCAVDVVNTGEKHHAIKLSREDAKDISTLYKEVWLKAYEYPKEWREKRAMREEEIKKEMDSGYLFFGVRINGKLVGVYKASVTERGSMSSQKRINVR